MNEGESKMDITKMMNVKMCGRCLSAVALIVMMLIGTSVGVSADEEDAKRILKAMSEYMTAQESLSFDFDGVLEVITADGQKLALTNSGSATLKRPDKLHVTRSSGFADIEMSFDGNTLTLLGKNLNLYTQIELPGTLEQLIDALQNTYNRPLPAADLLLSNSYDELMHDVVDVKDLGSGVIGGVECDYLAFRTDEVDWQIWIAQGERPFPYRFAIHSKLIDGGPQYIVQPRNWKSGDEVAAMDFSFNNSTQAEKVELEELKEMNDLPTHFMQGDTK